MPDDNPRLLDVALKRRQRSRNLVLLIVLLAVAALFYAIAVVKFRVSGHV